MPTTTGCEFGDVVLVPFPFTDRTTAKKRPAVIVSSEAYNRGRPDVILMAITSQVRPFAGVGEASIQSWREAGLLKPSIFKPLLATIDAHHVLRRLGTLQAPDREALRRVVRFILGE